MRTRDGRVGPIVTCALLLAGGCTESGDSPVRSSPDSLPGGAWELAVRLDDGALLVGARGAASIGGRVPVLHWRPDAPARIDTADLIEVPLPRVGRVDAVRLGRWRAPEGAAALFGVPGMSPPLLPLAPGSARSVLEAEGTLWLVTADGRAAPLVAETAGGFDRARLEALQREGEVILYWATVPVSSPGGEQVAYATNREAVDRSEQGQSIWLVDVRTGRERPLLARPGEWFRPEGWLGGELLFTGGFAGVRAIDPATGDVRPVGAGVLVGTAPATSALAEAVGVPDSTRARVLAGGAWAEVPLPAGSTGMLYAPQGAFAPDGRRLLLQAATPDGVTRQFAVYDVIGRAAASLEAPVPLASLDGWPRWLDAETLLFTTTGRSARGGRAGASWTVRVP